MADPAAVAPRREYTPTEIESALRTLVMVGRSPTRAAELTGIPKGTLWVWATSLHRERLEEIAAECGPELERMAIERFRGFVLAADEVKLLALEETRKELESGRARDPSRSMQNIANAQGLAVQRMLELDGRPQGVPPDQRTLGELLRKLEDMGAIAQSSRPVDSTATEIPAD